jgi:circadian clock protein KaiC
MVSFLADDIVRLRYVSINGQLRKMLLVVKMRRSRHSIDMCEYSILPDGVLLGKPLRGYQGLTTGVPGPWLSALEAIPASRPRRSPQKIKGKTKAKGKKRRGGRDG